MEKFALERKHFCTYIWPKLKVGRTADARRQLNAIISMTPIKIICLNTKAVGEARKLLKTGTAVSASILRSPQRKSAQTITICLGWGAGGLSSCRCRVRFLR
jgi:hypothetical protein